MAEKANFPHRVFVADVRDDGTYVRVTWHSEQSTFVVSQWDNRGCIAATRISAESVPELTNLLTNGLADALARERSQEKPARPARRRAITTLTRLWTRIRHARPAADVLPLRLREVPALDEVRWMSESC